MRKPVILWVILLSHLAYASMYLNTARIAYYNQKDYERAKKACLQGIEKGERHFELYAILSGCEIGLANWEASSAALKNAFTVDSSKTMEWIMGKGGGEKYFYQAFYFTARLQYNTAQYDKALNNLHYARLLDPMDIRTYILKGAILYKLDKMKEANREYKKVLDLDPENPDVYFLIGKSLFESKKYDSSLTYFANAVKFYEPPYNRTSRILFQYLPEIDKTLVQRIIRLWVAQKMDELDQILKVDLELEQGLDVHIKNVEQFFKISNDLARSYYYKGMAHYNLKEDSLALQDLLRSLELRPDDLDALYFTGEIVIKLKQYESAAGFFERLTQLKDDDLYAWFYLGVCYTQLKQYKKAIDVYENKVLQLDPENIDTMTNLAFIYSELGNSQKSFEYLQKAEELQKKKKGG